MSYFYSKIFEENEHIQKIAENLLVCFVFGLKKDEGIKFLEKEQENIKNKFTDACYTSITLKKMNEQNKLVDVEEKTIHFDETNMNLKKTNDEKKNKNDDENFFPINLKWVLPKTGHFIFKEPHFSKIPKGHSQRDILDFVNENFYKNLKCTDPKCDCNVGSFSIKQKEKLFKYDNLESEYNNCIKIIERNKYECFIAVNGAQPIRHLYTSIGKIFSR